MDISKKGFSLVELVIVIAIMGVLLTVVAPLFLNYLGKAQIAACRENRDRLKKDMYNELIAFAKNDMEASSYLDEYMEKGGYKKVSANTYEGICSTNGTVTFEIKDIDSVEAISISAKCSVHGGDEVVVTEPKKEESGAQKYSSALIGNDNYSKFTSNRTYTANSLNFKNLTEDEIAKQYPYIAADNFYFGSGTYLKAQVDMLRELAQTPGSKLDTLYNDIENDIREYYKVHPNAANLERDLLKMGAVGETDTVRNSCKNVTVVTEIQIPLGELYGRAISDGADKITAGSTIPVRQYLYMQIEKIPYSAGNGAKGSTGNSYLLCGYRDIDVVVSKIESKHLSAMQGLLNKEVVLNSDGKEWDSRSIMSINTAKSSEMLRTDNWTFVDKIDKPY